MGPEDEATRPGAVSRALWTGALVGLAVGAGDALVSWTRLDQFLPGAGGKLRCALFAAGLYAFGFAVLLALSAAVLVALMRWTALGELLEHASHRQRARRAADPRRALTGLAVALAAVPCLAGACYLSYRFGAGLIKDRNHPQLESAAIVGVTLALLVAAVPATFAVARVLEGLLALLPAWAVRIASHPIMPALGALKLVLLGGGVAAFLARRTLALLPLRPFVTALVAMAAVPLLLRPATALLRRIPRRVRPILHPVVVVAPLLLALVLGGSGAVRKGADRGTGLAMPLSVAVRAIFDLDRDGYSSVLGGGDCNDLDGDIHPDAVDFPDDGIDQNCIGGDVHLRRSADDAGFVPRPAAVPADSNIVLITIDTLRADHLGAYGYGRATSPTLDALGARGTVFLNAWAHAPSTRYSVPAIITGRYPSQVLWDDSVWWPALRPENHTLAEILKERGYTTGAILNYTYFEQVRRMDQGFDEYDNEDERLHVGNDPASTRGSSSREQADKAIAWLDKHAAAKFFLWVHFYDPHYEYERHPDDPASHFGDDKVALYDGEIRFTDDHIARVLAELARLGLTDKTIIAVTGDHGEGFGEHGIDFHGYHLYAAQTKVPLFIVAPGLPARRVTTPVGHVDLLPTLANLAGAPAEATMSGRSLVPILDGSAPADADRDVYQEVDFEGPGDRYKGTQRRGLVTLRWHLLYNLKPDRTFELYDLAADPAEAHDVSESGIPDKPRERLLGWIDAQQYPPEIAAKLAGAVRKDPPAPRIPLAEDFDGKLRLLGVDLSTTHLHPGDPLEITWYFQSERRLTGSWRPFVHIEGPDRFVADHDPVGGALPIAHWKPGTYIADPQTFRFPPTARRGTYTLFTGIYQGNERLGGKRVRVAEVIVE